MSKDIEGKRTSAAESGLVRELVDEQNIAEIVSRWTGIPVSKLTSTERQKLLSLADVLHKRVVGQDEAVEAVAQAVLRSRAGLARPEQPTGSFLFLGPTGVGKSELAKALAAELFDDEKHMVRIGAWSGLCRFCVYVCGLSGSALLVSALGMSAIILTPPSKPPTTPQTHTTPQTCQSTASSTRSPASSAPRPGTSATTRAGSSRRRSAASPTASCSSTRCVPACLFGVYGGGLRLLSIHPPILLFPLSTPLRDTYTHTPPTHQTHRRPP